MIASKDEESHIKALTEVKKRAGEHNVILALDNVAEKENFETISASVLNQLFHQKKALNITEPKGKPAIKTLMD